MAIIITQERKKQKYLILILMLVIFATLFIVWLGFFRKGGEEEIAPLVSAPETVFTPLTVEIDWAFLDNLRKETFQSIQEIEAFKDGFGRKNPFIPY